MPEDYVRVSSRSRLLDDGWEETLKALEGDAARRLYDTPSEADDDEARAGTCCERAGSCCSLTAVMVHALRSPLRACCFACGCLLAFLAALALGVAVLSTKQGSDAAAQLIAALDDPPPARHHATTSRVGSTRRPAQAPYRPIVLPPPADSSAARVPEWAQEGGLKGGGDATGGSSSSSSSSSSASSSSSSASSTSSTSSSRASPGAPTNFVVQQLRQGGFTAAQLRANGFRPDELRAGGFTDVADDPPPLAASPPPPAEPTTAAVSPGGAAPSPHPGTDTVQSAAADGAPWPPRPPSPPPPAATGGVCRNKGGRLVCRTDGGETRGGGDGGDGGGGGGGGADYRYGGEGDASPAASRQRRRRLLGHGLSEGEALSLLKDSSRAKFEADTAETLSLNSTCLVAAFEGGGGGGEGGGEGGGGGGGARNGGSRNGGSRNGGARARARGGPQQLLTFSFSRGVFLSYVPSAHDFAILASVRAIRRSETSLLRRCRWRKLGIGVPFPLGTTDADADSAPGESGIDADATRASRLLLASLAHAVPLYEALGRGHPYPTSANSSAATRLPQERGLPQALLDGAMYVPLLFKGHGGIADASLGATDAFVSSVRALTTRPAAQLAADVATLARERCVCFGRFEATGAPYNLLATRRRSLDRWHATRRRIMHNSDAILSAASPAHAAAATLRAAAAPVAALAPAAIRTSRSPSLLVVVASAASEESARPHVRPAPLSMPPLSPPPLTLHNQAELLSKLRAAGLDARPLHVVPLHVPPQGGPGHATRVSLLGRAAALVSVGSAALGHAAFLPADEGPTALVEIYAASAEGVPWDRMRRWADPGRAARATARRSLERSPHDPLRGLSDALLGAASHARVAAWALPHANCTTGTGMPVGAAAAAGARSCASRRVVVDSDAVVQALVQRLLSTSMPPPKSE